MAKTDFETGICVGMILGKSSTTIKPVINPLTVTENGIYTAPAGVDGYSPVSVGVPDRYDEGYNDGYKQGYSDGSDYYKKLYEQAVGNLPDVTDDNGNVIPNAFTNPDNDSFADYLKNIEFNSHGGSVTSHGLDGDTEFKFEVYVLKYIYANGQTRYRTSVKFTTKNLTTGKEYVQSTNAYQTAAEGDPPYKIKITGVTVSTNNVQINFDYINGTGDKKASGYVRSNTNVVGGTKFRGTKDWGSSVTQNSDYSETVDNRT